jgi:glycosyltransferase involved in cell wall biosynthesis
VHTQGANEEHHKLKKSFVEEITALVITLNEKENISRCLEKLTWCTRIVVVDSGSDDGTIEIAGQFDRVAIHFRPFDSFAAQCNFGLSLIQTEWVLSLDADHVLTDALIREIHELDPPPAVAGYVAPFVYCIFGRPLRGTLYPPRTVLYRRRAACYVDEGHGHRVRISGQCASLQHPIFHDDRKPLCRFVSSQVRYARREVDFLERENGQLGLADRLRRMGWPMVVIAPLYGLIVKRCILDGWPGWYYALQRLIAESVIALEIMDRRLRK